MNQCRIFSYATLFAGLFSYSLLASESGTVINMRGTLFEPASCSFSPASLDIFFGDDIMSTKLGDDKYKRQLEYTLTCQGEKTKDMTITIVGTGASIPAFLKTNIENLVIGFQDGSNSTLSLNQEIKFTYPTIPTIYVRPVAIGSVKAGVFSAMVSLKVNYE